MEVTEYHVRVLKMLNRFPRLTTNQLATKVHPTSVGVMRMNTEGTVKKAITQLELANMVECSNPDIKTWVVTLKGLANIACV